MVSSLMVRCHPIRPWEVETTPSIHSSVRLDLVNMSRGVSSWIWSPRLWMKSGLELTDSCSTPNNSLLERLVLTGLFAYSVEMCYTCSSSSAIFTVSKAYLLRPEPLVIHRFRLTNEDISFRFSSIIKHNERT